MGKRFNIRERIERFNRLIESLDYFDSLERDWDIGTQLYEILVDIRVLEKNRGLSGDLSLRSVWEDSRNRYIDVRRTYLRSA